MGTEDLRLAVHLGDVGCFAEVVGNVSGVRDGRDGVLYNARFQPRFLGYTDSWQRRYGACKGPKNREHSVRCAPREEHILEEYKLG